MTSETTLVDLYLTAMNTSSLVRVLTVGTNPFIGWERGRIAEVGADHVLLVPESHPGHTAGTHGLVAIPFHQIARVEFIDDLPPNSD